jgi:hypothetical protein
MPRGLRHVALSISFLSPIARLPDAFFVKNMASARSTIFGLDLFPEPQPSQLEFRKLFANFPPQTIFLRFARTPTASRKHP